MGRPVVHWELWSENPDKAAEFYQRVFDWNIQHIPDLKYHVVDTGGGGINGGPEEAGSHPGGTRRGAGSLGTCSLLPAPCSLLGTSGLCPRKPGWPLVPRAVSVSSSSGI